MPTKKRSKSSQSSKTNLATLHKKVSDFVAAELSRPNAVDSIVVSTRLTHGDVNVKIEFKVPIGAAFVTSDAEVTITWNSRDALWTGEVVMPAMRDTAPFDTAGVVVLFEKEENSDRILQRLDNTREAAKDQWHLLWSVRRFIGELNRTVKPLLINGGR